MIQRFSMLRAILPVAGLPDMRFRVIAEWRAANVEGYLRCTVKIYWGGADTVMCMGEADVSDLVDLCLDHSRPAK